MADGAPAMVRLGAIRAVTTVVADLEAIERAYGEVLGYRAVARGALPPDVAMGWGAPAAAGRRWLTLAPESGEAVYLRFVQGAPASGWRALTTHGWNATEIVVQDLDEVERRLKASTDFEIIGPPKALTRFPMIRALQTLGPAGECLYFTEIGDGSGLDLAKARSLVGRVFIVVAGGGDLDAMFDAYAAFGNPTDPPVRTPVRVLSWANGLPLETEHPHGLIKLAGGTLIELDGYPAMTGPRSKAPGDLPPGMAMVSFDVDALPTDPRLGPVTQALLPQGGRAASFVGAAGEMVELVEAGSVGAGGG